MDEPVTPEPAYNDALPLPDLHRAAGPSSSVRGSNSDGGPFFDVEPGYTFPSAAVGVYDDAVDRYGGWVPGGVEDLHQHSQQQHTHF